MPHAEIFLVPGASASLQSLHVDLALNIIPLPLLSEVKVKTLVEKSH